MRRLPLRTYHALAALRSLPCARYHALLTIGAILPGLGSSMYTRGPAGGVGGAGVLWSLFVSSKEVWKLVSSGSFLCRCGVAVGGEEQCTRGGSTRTASWGWVIMV